MRHSARAVSFPIPARARRPVPSTSMLEGSRTCEIVKKAVPGKSLNEPYVPGTVAGPSGLFRSSPLNPLQDGLKFVSTKNTEP